MSSTPELPEAVAWGLPSEYDGVIIAASANPGMAAYWKSGTGRDSVNLIPEPAVRDHVTEQVRQAREDERAAVVAWLRAMAARGATHMAGYFTAAADAIERGDHLARPDTHDTEPTP